MTHLPNHLLDVRQRFLLSMIIDDRNISESQLHQLINDVMPLADMNVIEDNHFEEYLSALNNFLAQAGTLRNLVAQYEQHMPLSFEAKLDDYLMNCDSATNCDVLQDDDETRFTFKPNQLQQLATGGLATCLSIGVVGNKLKGQTSAAFGHFSSSDIDLVASILAPFKNAKKFDTTKTHLYIVGGCIGTLDHDLQMIQEISNLNTPYSFRVCLTDGENNLDKGAVFSITHSIDNKVAVQYHHSQNTQKLIPALSKLASISLLAGSKHQIDEPDADDDIAPVAKSRKLSK